MRLRWRRAGPVCNGIAEVVRDPDQIQFSIRQPTIDHKRISSSHQDLPTAQSHLNMFPFSSSRHGREPGRGRQKAQDKIEAAAAELKLQAYLRIRSMTKMLTHRGWSDKPTLKLQELPAVGT